MVQTTGSADNEEPVQRDFKLPSQIEHTFQCTDVDEEISDDPDIVFAKIEVVGGDEEGRTTMIRLSLDDEWKGFFATRLFLKAIGEKYKGKEFPIDTDEWIGKQFKATIVHNQNDDKTKTYANIEEYNFDDMIETRKEGTEEAKPVESTPSIDDPCKCGKEAVSVRNEELNMEICTKCKKPVIVWDE